MTEAEQPGTEDNEAAPGKRRRLGAGPAFAVLMVVATGWALGSPVGSAPDEVAHMIRAAAVVRGQFLTAAVESEHGEFPIVRVPAVFERAHEVPQCYQRKREVTADCAPPMDAPRVMKETLTSAGNHPPLYYVIVGLPSLVLPDATGMYAMRLVSASVSALFLAWALASAAEWGRSPLLLLGTALAVTPMALYLAASVNPSSVEIAAGVCLWACGLVVVGGGPAAQVALPRAGTAAAGLALVRTGSLLSLAVIAAVLAGVAGVAGFRAVMRRPAAGRWAGVVGASVALALAWVAVAGASALLQVSAFRDLPRSAIVRISIGKLPEEVTQMIGVFGALDSPAPALTRYIWLLALGFVAVLGLVAAGPRLLVALFAVLAAITILPVSLEVPLVREHGFVWQGRYSLPIAAGIPILAAFSAGLANVLELPARRLAAVLATGLAVAHVGAFTWNVRRYAVGFSGPLDLLRAPWQPPAPIPVLLLVVVAGAAAYAWMLVAASPSSRPEDRSPTTEPSTVGVP